MHSVLWKPRHTLNMGRYLGEWGICSTIPVWLRTGNQCIIFLTTIHIFSRKRNSGVYRMIWFLSMTFQFIRRDLILLRFKLINLSLLRGTFIIVEYELFSECLVDWTNIFRDLNFSVWWGSLLALKCSIERSRFVRNLEFHYFFSIYHFHLLFRNILLIMHTVMEMQPRSSIICSMNMKETKIN